MTSVQVGKLEVQCNSTACCSALAASFFGHASQQQRLPKCIDATLGLRLANTLQGTQH
jgi:hypothetical protein